MEKERTAGPGPGPGPGPSTLPPNPTAGKTTSSSLSQEDLSRMPDNPPKHMGHRRAHSEILTLPDDVSFESDLGVVGFDDVEPDFDVLSMYIDMDKVEEEDGMKPKPKPKPKPRHGHSQSMDGSIKAEDEMRMSMNSNSDVEVKKAMSAAKLAELALIDPKRAKRIWANRQSAARSKERKMRYISELERKVQTLQTESTSLSAQLSLLQRDTNGLTAENGDLKLRLQTMEQQVHLQDALNEALKEEIQHMKMLTGQAIPNGGPMMNFPASFASSQPFYQNNQAMRSLMTAQQFQQLQIHSQKQQHQLQQQQLQQLQHQQLQQQQRQQEQTHQLQCSVDFKLRPSVAVLPQKENVSDPK